MAFGRDTEPRLPPARALLLAPAHRQPDRRWGRSAECVLYRGGVTVLLDADRVSVRRADRVLFAELSVTVTDRDRVGVVGINGTGKSTLLRVLAGIQTPEEGQVRRGRGVRVGLLDQDAALPEGSVGQAVGEGWQAEALLDRLGVNGLSDRHVADLSGGQTKRVALARVLAHAPELLILDEPTNHLDLPAISWLEAWLSGFAGGGNSGQSRPSSS